MDREELEAKYHELRNCKRTAEHYGTSSETIRRLLIKYGIPRTGWKVPKKKAQCRAEQKNARLSDHTIQDIVDTYLKTKSIRATSAIVGCAIPSVSKYLSIRGISPGRGGNQVGMKITDAQILEAVKTMTRHEIAEKYGVHVETLERRMRKLGVHAIRNTSAHDLANEWHYSKAYDDLIKRAQPGFEFVSTRHRRCRLRCKECGTITERNISTIREKNVRCDVCYQAEQEAKKEANQRIKSIGKLIKVLLSIEESKKPKTCPCCGDTFYSPSPTAKWCKRCKNRGGYRERAKKYGAEYEHGITLRKVFMRDGGICQICGKPVDWHDRGWNGYIGAMYPTIDHIKALAVGGNHTWNNVQLAHAMCNSVKGANG